MSELIDLADHVREAASERDLSMVRGAIELVARGAAKSVTLVSLRNPEVLLPSAIALGQACGVVVRGDRQGRSWAIVVGGAIDTPRSAE
jgi:hypothetical protein